MPSSAALRPRWKSSASYHGEQTERVSAVQARYYENGAEISRTEQLISHTRTLRERQRADLAQARGTLNELALHIERDERELLVVRAELVELAPKLTAAASAEHELAATLEAAEHSLQLWQTRWEEFNRALGAAHQTTQVERARIEQLENQQRRLAAQADRLAIEQETLASQEADVQLKALADGEALARSSSEQLAQALSSALERTQSLRSEQLAVEARLEDARGERERLQAELLSLEALQQAAFSHGTDGVAQWLGASGLAGRPRVAAALEVAAGWERAVETALGDYLEAVCVEHLDEIGGALEGFAGGTAGAHRGRNARAPGWRRSRSRRSFPGRQPSSRSSPQYSPQSRSPMRWRGDRPCKPAGRS